ncbi:MAG: sensor domain-containing diguanylate cyclase, partial [Thiobacillus sp.]
MKAWFGRLSLRYKLTLAALAVEAVMLALLIANGVGHTRDELQQQAERHARETGQALAGALLAPLAQRDDASVGEIVDALQRDGGLKMVAVRDSRERLVHRSGTEGTSADFRVTQPVTFAGQRYGEITLVLSGAFIAEARARYVRESLSIALAALLVTGVL